MEDILVYAKKHVDDIWVAWASVVAVASVIIKLTPTKKDDTVLAKVLSILSVLALNPQDKKEATNLRR